MSQLPTLVVVVVDGDAGDIGGAVGRHGDLLGGQYLAEPLTLNKVL